MGNTSSSASSKLRKDSTFISRPRALGRLGNSRTPLGPEFVVSPYPGPIPSPSQNRSQVSFQSSLNPRRSTFSASQTSILSGGAVEVRRTRSANASPGPTREERSVELLGAPPPYTLVDASSSNFHLAETRDGHLAVPGATQSTKGHRRAASSVTPGDRRDPRLHAALRVCDGTTESQNLSSPNYRSGPVPEEFGYGVGSGLKAGSRHAHVVVIPPAASSSSGQLGAIASSSTTMLPPTQNMEDPLELLKQYKTVFIIDDSGSMSGDKWTETREALASLADTAARYDTDGIDAYFLNANRAAHNMRSAASVKRQFDSIQPQGISLLAHKLEELLHDYLSELDSAKQDINRGDLLALQRVKPVNYIIITDGVPTDDPEAVIVQAARRLDNGHFPVSQVGIQFVQIGNDPRATEALRELDDGLAKEYGIRDMVDSTPYTGGPLDSEMLIKILLGGINRRVDKKGAKSVLS